MSRRLRVTRHKPRVSFPFHKLFPNFCFVSTMKTFFSSIPVLALLLFVSSLGAAQEVAAHVEEKDAIEPAGDGSMRKLAVSPRKKSVDCDHKVMNRIAAGQVEEVNRPRGLRTSHSFTSLITDGEPEAIARAGYHTGKHDKKSKSSPSSSSSPDHKPSKSSSSKDHPSSSMSSSSSDEDCEDSVSQRGCFPSLSVFAEVK